MKIAIAERDKRIHDERACTGWAWAEMGWWMYMRMIVMPRFQKETAPPSMSREERRRLWERCVQRNDCPKKFVRGWFFDAPFDKITRQDCDRWLSWGLWGHRLDRLTAEVRIAPLDVILFRRSHHAGLLSLTSRHFSSVEAMASTTHDPVPAHCITRLLASSRARRVFGCLPLHKKTLTCSIFFSF